VAGAGIVYEKAHVPLVVPGPSAPVARVIPTTPKPVIESYDSQKATIIEMPTEREDVKVVMVLDDTIPADL
ncbi:MAG TPA: hypothetical protein VLU46_12890, partial [Thermoanaerobaculia bacterium]|nr:hypothetical protein [Thermoanaerobaculia bacterium]